jgi:hypothetical protein
MACPEYARTAGEGEMLPSDIVGGIDRISVKWAVPA